MNLQKREPTETKGRKIVFDAACAVETGVRSHGNYSRKIFGQHEVVEASAELIRLLDRKGSRYHDFDEKKEPTLGDKKDIPKADVPRKRRVKTEAEEFDDAKD